MEIEGTTIGVMGREHSASGGYDAFISYRRSDERVAAAVYELLVLFGQRVFFDRRCIPLGHGWDSTILLAARGTRTLLVLWSRSAAASSEMQRELTMVPEGCRIVPLRLDMSPLPPELSSRQALEGLDVGSRILARGRELVVQGGQSQAEAMTTILRELRSEGVELTPEQARRARAYFGVLKRGLLAAGLGTAAWLWSRASRAAVSPAGASALVLGVGGVGMAHVLDDDAQLYTEIRSLHAALTAESTQKRDAHVALQECVRHQPVSTPAAAPCPGDGTGASQRLLGETQRRLADCDRESKADLAECRKAGRESLDALTRRCEASKQQPSEANTTAMARYEQALGACTARQATLEAERDQGQTALAAAQAQLRECRAASSPPEPGPQPPDPVEPADFEPLDRRLQPYLTAPGEGSAQRPE